MGTRLGTTFHHCRLILEMETEPGTKSRFHYLCPQGVWGERILRTDFENPIIRPVFHRLIYGALLETDLDISFICLDETC